MKLSEIFDQLTYGELSQLNLGGGEAGAINESNYKQIVAHVNMGLLALYKRFPLKGNSINLSLQSGRFSYPLHSKYAVSNTASTEPVKYILDTVDDPFTDDLFKVESVLTESDWELGLNDDSDYYACSTPSANVLRVPADIVMVSPDLPDQLRTTYLEINYRASHPVIVLGDTPDIDAIELELPYSHLEPLLLYIASRVNNPIGMTNEFHAGNSYAAKYEQACQQLETFNLNVDQGSQNTRLEKNGWV